MKLQGIKSSKRRLAAHRRSMERRAPPADGLDPRFHQPAPGPDGTIRCSCSITPFSPAMYAKHLAGKPNLDIKRGVYVTGRFDPWLEAQERIQRAADMAPAEQDRGEVHTDGDGNSWQPFVNNWQQRQLRCVSGPRRGEAIHAPPQILRPDAFPQPRRRRTPLVADGVSSSEFFD